MLHFKAKYEFIKTNFMILDVIAAEFLQYTYLHIIKILWIKYSVEFWIQDRNWSLVRAFQCNLRQMDQW